MKMTEQQVRDHAARNKLPLPDALLGGSRLSNPTVAVRADGPAGVLSGKTGQDSRAGKKQAPRRAQEPNRTEREYEMMLKAQFPGATIKWEAYKLRLANRATYTPDFSVLHQDGRLEFHEVKGSFIFPKALVKPRIAAEMFRHRFVLAQKLKSGWEITELAGARA